MDIVSTHTHTCMCVHAHTARVCTLRYVSIYTLWVLLRMKVFENETKRSGDPEMENHLWLLGPTVGAVLAFGGLHVKRFCGSSGVSPGPWSVWIAFIPMAQIVSGVSAISSSLCRIISRSTVYFRISFSNSRSSSSWSFWMKLLRTGISNFIYWATS